MGLKRDFSSAVFYTAISKYSGIVIQLLITAVLSRLLTPSDFGIVAIATILIQFFNTISEAGIGAAIIQKKTLTQKEIEGLFSFTIIIGILFALIFFLCSDLIADYYNNNSLANVCKWLSILILFSGADIVTNGLLLKQKKFKTIAIRTLSVQIITGIISIFVATIGWGMYALVLSAISSKVIIFIINYCCNPIGINFYFNGIKKIASYSTYQFLFNILNYFSRNVDKLIIGKLIGMNQLGYYEKSYRLMTLPLSNITYVLTPVMHPFFSEMQNEKEMLLEKYLKLLTLIGCLSFPLMAFLFFDAKELIFLIFGEQWSESILPLKILALTTAMQVLHATTSGIFQAVNDTKGLFHSSLLSSILIIIGFVISALIFKTIIAVAISFLVTCTLGSIIVFYFLLRSFNKGLNILWSSLRIPMFIGVVDFIILGSFALLSPISNNILNIGVNIILTVIVATTILWWTNKNDLKDIIKLFHR